MNFPASLSQLLGENATVYGAAALAVLLPIAGLAARDYRNWYALGAGGLPHNWKGWLIASALRLLCARDTRSVTYYDHYLSGIETRSFLGDTLPKREGARPMVGAWAAPHRQLEATASRKTKKQVSQDMKTLGAHPQLEAAPSQIEGGCPAVFVRDHIARHPVYKKAPREVFHMHETDGSMHCILSASDAKLVLSLGWGERHGLNGKLGFPPGYTLIYAPRDTKEEEVVRRIAHAAAQYGLDGEMHE